jgi:ligand-binding sensor domain-containing protein/signal transduction histidine kinase
MPKHGWTLAVAALWLGACSPDASGAAGTFLRAGARYAIDVWEADDGLPENAVTSVTQTRDGYLWLGTLNGLVRFDGIRFTVFDEINTPGLISSRIFTLFEDSHSNLWVGTETAGTALIKNGRVLSLGLGQGGSERRLAAICEDSGGAVWLYTMDGQLWRYQDGRTNVFRVGPSLRRAMIMEAAGLLWVGTDQRLSALRPATALTSPQLMVEQTLTVGRLDFLLASRRGGYWRLADGSVQKWSTNRLERDWGPYPWSRAPVSAACEDREGNLVVGTLGAGVYWFDPQGKATNLSTNQGLSHNSILSLLVDREDTLWVGTDGGGLNRVKRQAFDVVEESRGLTVQSVCEDGQGGIWIGFNEFGANKNGAAMLKEGQVQWFGPAQGLMNASVWAMFVDRQQQVWAGTYGGLFQLLEGQFRQVTGLGAAFPVILAIHQDRAGRLWLGTKAGLLRREEPGWKTFTTRDGLSADEVRTLADDPEGNLWIGTVGGGLNRLRDGHFTSFRNADQLPCDDISALYVDSDGVLWVGTFGRGLARMQAGQWTRYTTREGLISNSIGYLIEDSQGDFWIGSNAGLMRLPKKALNDVARGAASSVSCRVYTQEDGLPTRECTLNAQPHVSRPRQGQLWFPTVKGLASVNPALLKPNTNPPPVVIESVLIDDRLQTTNNLRADTPVAVTMRPNKERLEIRYTSLNLAAPDRARFRYRLEGHETGWTEAGNTRVAHYSKLPPGPYHFLVTACNEDGIWNEAGSSMALTVLPPFWRTWWFLSASAAFLLGTIVAVVHYVSTQRLQRQVERLRQQEALEQERARIARDIHDQLGASLTQVSLLGELVESDKHLPQEVEAHARQISQTARDTARTLDEIVWTVNPSNDTLDGLVTYVCKYAQEYLAVAGLRYRLDVTPQLPATPISPEVRHNLFLAAKEAITNVVRHAQASAVWVRLKLDPSTFTLEIQDDGCGPAGLESKAGRNGLRNMRKRMEDIGGQFAIGPAPDRGTLVRLTAPLSQA